MKRSGILENRRKWIAELKKLESKKAEAKLENYHTGGRCCLGHGCAALGLERTVIKSGPCTNIFYDGESLVAPKSFVEKVGLKDSYGFCMISFKDIIYDELTALNDCSEATPQEIGEILEGMIEGGDDTPFYPLSDYEE